MKTILVTGSKGFVGKHLVKALSFDTRYSVYEYIKQSTLKELEFIIDGVDFIFHLAGEVHPKSTAESFYAKNVTLTQVLIDVLKSRGLKIPILLASSIHAENPKNVYGTTKKESEEIILQYGLEQKVPVYIYRLFHLFGEGCKPNYNSVISTWMYNAIRDLEIQVYDRGIAMHYSYVQDVINEFIAHLDTSNTSSSFFKPSLVYDTTLGEVVDDINEFKHNIHNPFYHIEDNLFKQKLFITFQDYYQQFMHESKELQ